MLKQLFSSITNKEKTDAIETLFSHSVPSADFFLMIGLSVLMATFGLLENNVAVIVGSMLIAPILYPMLGLSMGIIMADFSLMSKSFATLGKATCMSIIVAAIATLLFSSQSGELTNEIISRTHPSLLSLAVGAVAGFAAAFAIVKQKLNETLPGVAISVALIPPLAVVGIGIARLDKVIFVNSLLLFLINVIGVVVTASVVFSLMSFYKKHETAQEVVKVEEKKLEKEIEKAEKSD